MKKILFISHEASRTGAPILLLNLVKWIKENKSKNYKITVLFVKGGILVNEFAEYSEVYVLKNKIKKSKNLLNIVKKFSQEFNENAFYKRKWDLIFSNTIVNGKVLEKIRKYSVSPIISYIHELDYSIKLFSSEGLIQGTIKYSDFIVCGSKLVCNNLINNYNINNERINIVYSFSSTSINEKDKNVIIQLKEELKLPKDSLIVGMAGTRTWRKGIDFFTRTAEILKSENIYFIWIGDEFRDEYKKIKYDLEKLEKQPKILFLPSVSDYKKYFNIMDVFYLSSREDPYPLVMVEASSYGIPIICFKNAGGTQEFIDLKTGFVVSYGDITQVAKRILFYNNNRKILEDNKKYIQEKSIKFHSINNNASEIMKIIERII